jgi:hypothetical protein
MLEELAAVDHALQNVVKLRTDLRALRIAQGHRFTAPGDPRAMGQFE